MASRLLQYPSIDAVWSVNRKGWRRGGGLPPGKACCTCNNAQLYIRDLCLVFATTVVWITPRDHTLASCLAFCGFSITFWTQVNGTVIPMGDNTAPVLLNIHLPEGKSLSRGFASNCTLYEVKCFVAEVVNIPADQLVFVRLVSEGRLQAFASSWSPRFCQCTS